MIDSVTCENVRGITGEFTLGPKTLIIGPNGSGKTTIPHTAQLALNGYIPDSTNANKKTDYVFANSGADRMKATTSVNGHEIGREWKRGKTISEKILVDGVKANRTAAQGMIELAIGTDVHLVDVPSFWNQPASQKRRMLLQTVATPEELETLQQQESEARDTKNEKARERQAADKTVERLSASLAAREDQPTGDLARIREQLPTSEKSRKELERKIADGRANERARTEMGSLIDAAEDTKAELAEAEEQSKNHQVSIQTFETSLKKHSLEKPQPPMRRLSDPGDIKHVQRALDLMEGVYDALADTDFQNYFDEAYSILKDMLPNPEEDAAHGEKLDHWQSRLRQIERDLAQAKASHSESAKTTATLTQKLQSAREAGEKLASIGQGVDPNDVKSLSGIEHRIAELRDQESAIQELSGVKKELEQARVAAETAAQEEDEAKEELAKAIKRQSDIVQSASDELAMQSKAVLPYGNLRLEDDGKDVAIYWAKSKDLRIRRHTLSGGELATFDAAVGHALAPNGAVVIEAAECDDYNLRRLMSHLDEQDFQAIVLTCHVDGTATVPPDWTVIDMGSQDKDARQDGTD